jgi:hypothetical protein
MCTVLTLVLDTSIVRAHCVRSVTAAAECFLRHMYIFFLPSFHDIFCPCLTYIFIERPPIPREPGSSSWTASPVQQPAFEPPTSEDYITGETPLLEFQLDNWFHDTADEIGGTQLTGASLVSRVQNTVHYRSVFAKTAPTAPAR